jgi:hypothetical protein
METRNTPYNIKEVQTAINHLMALDLKTASYNEVRKHTDVLVNCGFSQTLFIKEFGVYRGRVVDSPEERYEFVKQISYPEDNSVMRYNRLSSNKFQVFYGVPTSHQPKLDQLIALIEVGSIADDEHINQELIQVGGWKMKQNVLVAAVGMTDVPYENAYGRKLRDHHLKHISEMENGKQLEMVDEFMANEFSKKVKKGNEWQYKISAAYGDGVFELGLPHNIGGIVFPSVKAGKKELNIAFHRNVVDTAMEIFASGVIRSTKLSNSKIWNDYIHICTTFSNGKFNWELPGNLKVTDGQISTMKENLKIGLPFNHSLPIDTALM